MADLTAIVERVDKLLLRHEELKRTNELLQREIDVLALERDALKGRLHTARARIDALVERLPAPSSAGRNPPTS